MSIKKSLEFLKENKTCVLATVTKDGTPQAATVGFSVVSGLTIVDYTLYKESKNED